MIPFRQNLYDPYRLYGVIILVSVLSFDLVFEFFLNFSRYAIWILSVNLVTFILFAVDKNRSKHDKTRLPDVYFYLLFVAGGFIGGAAGRVLFRHKIYSAPYVIMLTAGAVIHLFYNLL